MTTFTTTLEAREEIAEGTMAFTLRRPSGFAFKPGQAIDVSLTSGASAPEDQSTRHTFSIVSAPFQDHLMIATRMRDSAYKRALKSMPVGYRAGSMTTTFAARSSTVTESTLASCYPPSCGRHTGNAATLARIQ